MNNRRNGHSPSFAKMRYPNLHARQFEIRQFLPHNPESLKESYITWDARSEERNFKYRDGNEIKILVGGDQVVNIIFSPVIGFRTFRHEVENDGETIFVADFDLVGDAVVFINGSVMMDSSQYTLFEKTITFLAPLYKFDNILIMR